MRKYRWKIKNTDDDGLVDTLRQQLNDLPVELARLLVERGIKTFEEARTFFRAQLEELHDPFLMQGMQAAVDRLMSAIQSGEKIVVYGDYDVDGTTATALLTGFLQSVGANVEYFVPNRFEDGYGLSLSGIDTCHENEAKLIVALDCGVTAVDETLYAKTLGIDLVICDHHTPHDRIPAAVAVLDPKQKSCAYPYKELCGCGVTFKYVQAILKAMDRNPADAYEFLDLVALATASDIVSVTGENRILLREGINRLRDNPRIGIKCLADETRTRLSECSVTSIVFGLGPRINAAGRLGDAGRAVSLLLTDNEVEGAARARQLERLNQERRELDQETQDEALAKAERQLLGSDRHSIVLHDPNWHMGVIGIVASRLVDRYYRPAVMLTTANGQAKGSARSINGINVFEAIRSCEDLLSEYGGHAYAAGLTLPLENVEEFSRRFDQSIAEQIGPEFLDPVIEVDAELELSLIDKRFWAVLKQFEPFGPDNMQPIFLSSNLSLSGEPKTVGHDNSHVKFSVHERGSGNNSLNVIGFRMSDRFDILVESKTADLPIQLVYSIEENTWNGRTSLQLRARDIRLELQ